MTEQQLPVTPALQLQSRRKDHSKKKKSFNLDFLQTGFQYDFWKGPREISAGTIFTVLNAIMHVNIVNTIPAEISQGPF